MKQEATHTSTHKQPESTERPEEYQRQPWQRPLLQRLNLSLDTTAGSSGFDDGGLRTP